MDVLNEILTWSESRPNWQRDALRRLVTKGTLDEADFDILLAHCKSTHGLAEKTALEPLSESHIPKHHKTTQPITLNSLTHERGVNALAESQTVSFAKSLTVVYGKNAAGKSGYTRVLKKACRARGAEDILGNVLSEKAPAKPSAILRYTLDGVECKWNWSDAKTGNAELSNVSVFDRHCATVYLTQRTDVAFRPFGLDLFDKLASCCERVRSALEKERQELTKQEFDLDIADGTKAYDLISHLNALTNSEEIKAFAKFSSEDSIELKELKTQLRELKSDDREKNRKSLELRLKRLQAFSSNLDILERVLSKSNLTTITDIKLDITQKEQSLKKLELAFEEHSHLPGTGTDEWKIMWKASSEYSKVAYPGKGFPVIDNKANCVLCQQELREEARARFASFDEFMSATLQKDLEQSQINLNKKLEELEGVMTLELSDHDVLSEIEIEDVKLGAEFKQILKSAESKVGDVLKAIRSKGKINMSNIVEIQTDNVRALEHRLEERLKALSKGDDKVQIKKLEKELAELDARRVLTDNINKVTSEIERQKKLAVYSLCLSDTTTTAITKKSTDVTKKVVTEHLIDSFQNELKKLGFDHLEIELQPSGASRGALFHKLVISRAVNIDLQNVVSEGEARALSIAAFFAELSTASNQSGILFDDPVSSLDHMWREKVATRLVDEAKKRQVIVFTHDIVFLTALSRIASERKVDIFHQYIHREREGAGVSSQELPWVAMKINERIGALKQMWQEADKLERTSTKDAYEKEAIRIYGFLREAWERGLEEILIGGVVERYRHSVQSLKVKILSDITANDCDQFENGMTKCSKWLAGHDSAPAEADPVPIAAELKNDIEMLEAWVKEIRKRRK